MSRTWSEPKNWNLLPNLVLLNIDYTEVNVETCKDVTVVQFTFKLYSTVNKVHSFKAGKISVIARQHNLVVIPGNFCTC